MSLDWIAVEASKKDFEVWSPFVILKGLIAFHGICQGTGVAKFYNELMTSTKDYTQIMSVMALSVIQRK